MKAVLSNRIFLEAKPALQAKLKEELTYRIPGYDQPIIMETWKRTPRPNVISLPIGRLDLIPKDYEIVDKRVLVPTEFPDFRGTLRESQQAIYDELEDNAIINAKVSFGKTFTALALAKKLGQKTLVVVHTLALMHQWKHEVEKVFGFTPDMLGGGHKSWETPIVIGNVRTLYNMGTQLSKEFGLVVLDEAHHISARVFSDVIDKSYARYKIGLSGTIVRKDQKHVVLKDYFGPKVFQPPKENSMEPTVEIIKAPIYFNSWGAWANNVTALLENESYIALVSALVARQEAAGHKVLLVADRTEFLAEIASRNSTALITGQTKDRDAELNRLVTGECSTLCGTQSIFSEGFSYNPLSCLILATPVNNEPLLEQLIGRIVRICPDKIQPVVCDINLLGNITEKQAQLRLGCYMRAGYKISYV